MYKNIKHITISDNTNCSYKIKYISHRNVCDITVVMKSYPFFVYVMYMFISTNKGNNKITELRTILQRAIWFLTYIL